ncbi:MAG: deoxyguanosinetriphosphate triphosphohydrolase [Desulfobacterales bacterium]|nr:deoxyguanosinetriphosphate triphosphohydrolase [Desulfobacterales bacterium]
MTSREEFEKREENFISAYGLPSTHSRGRVTPEEPCPVRTEFQRDRERIVYCNAFRRLKHKTQVFLSPLGEHYRTRLTHTLEVAQIARTVARAMRLNEDLTEAIALGHDLGHTPFGHSGETVLKEIYSGNFSHPIQSLRVIDILEKNGEGLNLTHEVRDGILKHSKGYGNILPKDKNEMACTAEGQVVRVADIMAYLNHDLDDAIRSGVICEADIPENCVKTLGASHPERATTMVKDLIYTSTPQNGEMKLEITEKVHQAMDELRSFLYHNVYRSPRVHNEFIKSKKILRELYTFFLDDENNTIFARELDALEMPDMNTSSSRERSVCDFIASITDRYALELYERLFFPSSLV